MDQGVQTMLVIFGLVAVNAFFAAAEIAVISSTPIRIKKASKKGSKSAKSLNRLMEDQSRFLATIQVGITLAGFLASASAAVSISEGLTALLQIAGLPNGVAQSLSVLLVTALVSYITLVLGELVPKRIALQNPERLALLIARPIEFIAKATAPFTLLLTKSTNLIFRLAGGKLDYQQQGLTEEELLSYVKEHQELYTEEKRLIAGVVDFGDRLVRQLMVPRTEILGFPQDMRIDDVIEQARLSGYWNFPIYGQSIDDILGVISLKDILHHLKDCGSELPIGQIMRPPHFVPESKRALELLREMHEHDRKMVVVVDEYGGVAGLATLEDLLEEIVGEIAEDELSPDPGSRTELLLDAGESAEEIGDLLGIKFPGSYEYETLAGFILYTLGTIPTEGASIEVGGWRLTVAEMEGRKIEKVRAIPLANEGAKQ